MTTSPSWFDQDKFSRLIKKVGPKTSPGQTAQPIQVLKAVPVAPSAPKAEPKGGSPASTSMISLVSKSSLRSSESRALPTLPKRSALSPALKPIFTYEEPPIVTSSSSQVAAPPAKVSAEVRPVRAKEAPQSPVEPESGSAAAKPDFHQAGQDLAEAWEKVASLNDELFRTSQELERARSEALILREQMHQADQIADDRVALVAQIEELSNAAQERDDALREYADLREVHEALKREAGRPREESGPARAELEREIEILRQQLAEQEAFGANANTAGMEQVIETLRQELSALQGQAAQAREETTIAQRGLALSQKTLQETRDALREATEGSSMTKGNLDNLKSECATLVQQNMLLQAQLDQISRELSAAKSKLAARG